MPHMWHIPGFNAFFKSSPKRFILGLPVTAMTKSHTVTKASVVHLFLRRVCRNWFCCVILLLLVTSQRSPSVIMSWWTRSMITGAASISLMKRSRNLPKMTSAARGKSLDIQTQPMFSPNSSSVQGLLVKLEMRTSTLHYQSSLLLICLSLGPVTL